MTTNLARRTLAGAATLAVVLGGTTLAAAPAQAATLDPANEVNGGDYTMSLQYTDTLPEYGLPGSSLTYGPGTVTLDTGCPVGYQASARSFLVAADGTETPVTPKILPDDEGVSRGYSEDLSQGFYLPETTWAPNFYNLTPEAQPSGVYQLVITCDAPAPGGGLFSTTDPIGDSKYFVTYLDMNWEENYWVEIEAPAPEIVESATTLATGAVTQTSVELTASVAPAVATGTVQFTRNGENVGEPVAVSGGKASLTVDGLAPGTEYTFGAAFSGDEGHEASTASAITVTTKAAADEDELTPPADGSDESASDINVTVPSLDGAPGVPSGLSISVKPGSASLSGTAERVEGQAWQATGTLGNVTVKDDRRDATAEDWSLNGQASDFNLLSDGTVTGSIGAENLGWTPVKVSGAGEAGAAVAVGVDGGLSTSKSLATGEASDEVGVETTVAAGLDFQVPADTTAGDYRSTLTLTLI